MVPVTALEGLDCLSPSVLVFPFKVIPAPPPTPALRFHAPSRFYATRLPVLDQYFLIFRGSDENGSGGFPRKGRKRCSSAEMLAH